MFSFIRSVVTRTPGGVAVAVIAAAVAGLPGVAGAQRGLHIDVALPDPCQPVVVEQHPSQVWVEPTYRTVTDRQWVEPVYQAVTTRVWVPPTAADVVARQVFVPDQFGWRTVLEYDRRGQAYRSREWVLIAAAHFDEQCDPAGVVTPGHFQDVPERQLVCDGHWASVDRQEQVTPGHWESCLDAVVVPVEPPRPVFRLRLPF